MKRWPRFQWERVEDYELGSQADDEQDMAYGEGGRRLDGSDWMSTRSQCDLTNRAVRFGSGGPEWTEGALD